MPATNNALPVGLTDTQRAYIDGLRDLADFLAEHPEFPPPSGVYGLKCVLDRDQFVAEARKLPGDWVPEVGEHYFHLNRWFGPHHVSLYIDVAKVCERVEVTAPKTEWRAPADLLAPNGGDDR